MQEVLDGVPRVDAMAERAVAGPFDDSDHEIGDIQVTRALRAAFACLDGVDLIIQDQGHVMKSPPTFLRGAYRSAMRVALREWEAGTEVRDEVRKLFVLLPSMFLHKSVRGGLVPKSKMVERFASCTKDLLIQSRDTAVAAARAQATRRRRAVPICSDVRAESDGQTLCRPTGSRR